MIKRFCFFVFFIGLFIGSFWLAFDSFKQDLQNNPDVTILDNQSQSSHAYLEQIQCLPREHFYDKKQAQKSTQTILKWVDADGKVHYGDNPNKAGIKTGHVEDVSSTYQTAAQRFSLTIINEDNSVPPFAKNKITTDMKSIYELMSQHLNDESLHPVHLKVRIFGKDRDYLAYKNAHAPKLGASTGFFLPAKNEAVIFRDGRYGDEATYAIIRHEATHLLNASLFGILPLWLNEGIAEYYEHMIVKGLGKKIVLDEYYLEAINSSKLMPLRGYMQSDYTSWEQRGLHLSYGYAWSIVFFMMSNDQDKSFLLNALKHLVENYCQPVDFIAYFDNYYPGGLEAFEKRWLRWVQGKNQSSHYY